MCLKVGLGDGELHEMYEEHYQNKEKNNDWCLLIR